MSDQSRIVSLLPGMRHLWRHPGVWLSSGENVRTYRISIVRTMSQAITQPLFGGFNWLSSEIFWISKKCSKHSVEIKIANRMGFVDFYQCNQWLNNSSVRNPNFRSKLSGNLNCQAVGRCLTSFYEIFHVMTACHSAKYFVFAHALYTLT